MRRSVILRLLQPVYGLALAVAVAACVATESERPSDRTIAVDESAPFDEAQSASVLEEADAAVGRADSEAAQQLYERSALLWPGRVEAWQGLAALADDPETRRAAGFVAERVALYPGDQLYVQRELAQVLDLYAEEQAGLPDANETQLAYVRRLAGFYRHLYAARGQYQPLTPIWEF